MPRAAVSTDWTAVGRSSGQRSGRGTPVSTRKLGVTAQHKPARVSGSSRLALDCRQAAAKPGDSSSSPSTAAITPPYTSASTKRLADPSRDNSSASVTATVVRPGAPAGPQTATTDPRVGGGRSVLGELPSAPPGGLA